MPVAGKLLITILQYRELIRPGSYSSHFDVTVHPIRNTMNSSTSSTLWTTPSHRRSHWSHSARYSLCLRSNRAHGSRRGLWRPFQFEASIRNPAGIRVYASFLKAEHDWGKYKRMHDRHPSTPMMHHPTSDTVRRSASSSHELRRPGCD